MAEHNPNNERIKRQYLAYLKEAKSHSEATVDAVTKALARFEADTNFRDFKAFHSYGEVGSRRQGEIIRDLAEPQRTERAEVEEIVKAVVREITVQSASGSHKL